LLNPQRATCLVNFINAITSDLSESNLSLKQNKI